MESEEKRIKFIAVSGQFAILDHIQNAEIVLKNMSPQSKHSRPWLIIAGIVVVFVVLAGWLWHLAIERNTTAQRRIEPTTQIVSAPPSNPAPATHSSNAVLSGLQNNCGRLKSSTDAETARRILAELRAELSAMPTNEAVAAIRQFLDSKADADTHLGFKVAQNGLLDEAPTLRTFLLDELARLDPAAAADYSKVILSSMDSPDEWAVALRNLAWGDTSADARALLEEKTGELLNNQSWQQNPSAGYLEAFDVAVYLGDSQLLPTLSNLINQPNNPAVAHAAYLAMDRLVINNPATMLATLETQPNLMQGYETTRADYFARANVSDPQQLQILENYLLNPQISPPEIAAFAGIFPNANYMISPNLLTQTKTPNRAALVSRDAASLSVVQQWLADPRFASLRPSLQMTEVRLAGFVQQESQGQ
jgi:hypothetical protein